jgi:hypothetical protein
VTRLDFDFIAFNVALCLFSSGSLFAGSGGNLEGSYSGARILYNDPPSEVLLILVPIDLPDIPDAMVEIESFDGCLLIL